MLRYAKMFPTRSFSVIEKKATNKDQRSAVAPATFALLNLTPCEELLGVVVHQTQAGFVTNAVVTFIVLNADHFLCQAPEAAAEPHRWPLLAAAEPPI